jgi:two-component system LytT family response regulator
MENIKIVMVDDEQHALDALEIQLNRCCPEVHIAQKFNKPEEALAYLLAHKIDLLFLDIEMPRMNGFQLLSHWEDLPFEVIFTTAYDQFAVNAFRVSAFDYLLKPVDKDLLSAAIQNYKASRAKGVSLEQLGLLKDLINHRQASTVKIPIPVTDGLLFLEQHEIVRCEGDAGYTNIFLKTGKPILISKTLKEVEEQLFKDSGFLRVHQSHLINPAFLKKYIKGEGGYLLLEDGAHIPLSRRKREDFLGNFK